MAALVPNPSLPSKAGVEWNCGLRMSASRGLIKAAGPAVCSPVRLFLIEEFLLGRQNLVSDWVGRFDSPAR